MILEIAKGENNPILRKVCDSVTDFDHRLKRLTEDMKATMHAAKGVGIAAPQVSVNARVFIAVLGYSTKREKEVPMVNPEIVWLSDETDLKEEGCLSLPEVYGKVRRSLSIIVKFFDIKGKQHTLELNGLDARIVQHETDHINGVLFIDKRE